ncbi:tryptophan biosynthesis protein trpCF [Candidatus Blochmanniella vafra str. BVAF]|uniref:N-(5'-phosphoribosyl)anthranilate isomerase n=1 Tax=Blochmanniella vafra (strain BVAF) TaxID=859654 RepID=E8Q6C5_BLOVB|nr:bifunctional indole-3-glycerol-phosphate synthase TrpC/phosphoribosylanthranilate isomerase TrpF [Candidatus Blochmannia vafer]ADV33819.1 tryptophan biosynthesis protein trpCF [Candidatus Blochmannia vafer str. BVAF]
MPNTILNQIISYKKNWILNQKYYLSIDKLKTNIKNSKRSFYNTLLLAHRNNHTIFILEYKVASPSKNIICNNPDLVKIIHIYKKYASIISVVTDEKYFHGNFDNLVQISNMTTQPILCKDFFISEWQIYFARLHQADAILLMLSVIDDNTYRKLSYIAHSLNMGILTEITNSNELQRAIKLNAKIIGINNRNLNDLSIDLNRTINLSPNIPDSIIKISESGITNHYHIKKLKRYVHGFLIGTTLMSSSNYLDTAIKKLVLGENKICGLTRIEDAEVSYESGAIYGGLIFVNYSPRFINIKNAQKIISAIPNLNYVGVFQNDLILNIVNIVRILNLSAIQLHGTENQNYIDKLRTQLPHTCQIWKSINMNNQTPYTSNLLHIDRYLLDNKQGGSGKTFNWGKLSFTNIPLNKSILAGGLTINNCSKAAKIDCVGLDFNSGIEIQPGIKNHQSILKIFQILRIY